MEISSSIQNTYVNQSYTQAAKETTQKLTSKDSQKDADTILTLGESTEKVTYDRPKGLSSEQTRALQEYQATSQQQMLQSMMQNILQSHNQEYQNGVQLNFNGVFINASEFNLPPVGTTPEEAASAIAEGGNYSVDAVATRIFSLAEKIANGDPERLATMKSAVEAGFKQAGTAFNSMTKSALPQICSDTYDEIMKRFSDLEQKLAGSTESTIVES